MSKPSSERKSTTSRLLAFCFTYPFPSVATWPQFCVDPITFSLCHNPCTYPYHVQFISQMSRGRYNGTLSHCSVDDAIMRRWLAKRDERKGLSYECLIAFVRSMFQTPLPFFSVLFLHAVINQLNAWKRLLKSPTWSQRLIVKRPYSAVCAFGVRVCIPNVPPKEVWSKILAYCGLCKGSQRGKV